MALRVLLSHTGVLSTITCSRRSPTGGRSSRVQLAPQVTVQKRLVLAAATLPVLQVPLHAFSLVVPHLVALLESLSPTPEEGGRRRKGPRLQARTAAATAGTGRAALRQERGDASSRQIVGAGQRHDRLDGQTTPPPEPPDGENQRPEPAGAGAGEAGVGGQPEQSEASAEEEKEEAKSLETAWVSVFDLSATRLGPSLAIEVLFPSVLGVLQG